MTGLEIDPQAAERAEAHARDVFVVDLDVDDYMAKLAGLAFDVVLLGDVLEHLRDPLKVLRSVSSLLAPGGYVVASVPNVAHVDVRLALLQGRFDYRPWGLLDQSHLRFFTLSSFSQLLERAGLVPIELRRVVIPVFGSEIEIDRDSVDPASVRDALRDPEAETYQFVVKAVVDNGSESMRALAARCRDLEDQLHGARIESELARASAADAAEGERAALEAARRAELELAMLEATKTMRYTRGARNLYGRLRGRDV